VDEKNHDSANVTSPNFAPGTVIIPPPAENTTGTLPEVSVSRHNVAGFVFFSMLLIRFIFPLPVLAYIPFAIVGLIAGIEFFRYGSQKYGVKSGPINYSAYQAPKPRKVNNPYLKLAIFIGVVCGCLVGTYIFFCVIFILLVASSGV
jgi:hypothetical protein